MDNIYRMYKCNSILNSNNRFWIFILKTITSKPILRGFSINNYYIEITTPTVNINFYLPRVKIEHGSS